VDEWAARNGYSLVERELATKVSARLLEGLPVGLHLAAGVEVSGPLPPGIVPGPADLGICVSSDIHESPFPETLHVVFRNLTVGVGCRRGVEPSVLAHAVEAALAAIGATRHQVAAFASIDVKGDEPALVQVAREYRCALRLHSAEELGVFDGLVIVGRQAEQAEVLVLLSG
jgi:cobalt-precorrin 5A hydrolase